jgi:hypothetical protein
VLTLSDTEIKDGKAQGHFHGNAPHIQPKLFGIKITGGIGVGGGAGSSIGVVFSAKALAPTLAMKGTTQGREVSFSLTRDLKITYDFHLKGLGRDIESAVINAFGLDKSFTVPSSKPLYVWTIPDLTMASAGFSTKSEKTQVVIGKSGIEIASDVIVSSTPAP